MSPADRRDALVEVFLDLAHREGRRPSTSEIAREAGVAEGTIYRAFATKEELEQEALEVAFCPGPVRLAIDRIESTSLRGRLIDFTGIMQRRFTAVFGLMAALGLTQPPRRLGHGACYEAGRHVRRSETDVADDADDALDTAEDTAEHARHHRLLDTLQEIVVDGADEADRAALGVSTRDLVHRLRLLTFSGSHPGITEGQVLTPEEIVDTVLYGTLRRGPTGCTHPSSSEAPEKALTPTHRQPLTSEPGPPPKGTRC